MRYLSFFKKNKRIPTDNSPRSVLLSSTMEPSMVKREDKIPSKGMDGELSPKSGEEGEKVYLCEYCNKTFTRSWNYQRHVLIHSGRKPHKCEVCAKAFVLAAHLKIHMRIHTGKLVAHFTNSVVIHIGCKYISLSVQIAPESVKKGTK